MSSQKLKKTIRIAFDNKSVGKESSKENKYHNNQNYFNKQINNDMIRNSTNSPNSKIEENNKLQTRDIKITKSLMNITKDKTFYVKFIIIY